MKEIGIYLVGCPRIAKKVEVYFDNLWKLAHLNSSAYTKTVSDQQWQTDRKVPCWSHFVDSNESCRYARSLFWETSSVESKVSKVIICKNPLCSCSVWIVWHQIGFNSIGIATHASSRILIAFQIPSIYFFFWLLFLLGYFDIQSLCISFLVRNFVIREGRIVYLQDASNTDFCFEIKLVLLCRICLKISLLGNNSVMAPSERWPQACRTSTPFWLIVYMAGTSV